MRLVSDQNNKKHPTDNQNDFRWKVLLVDDDPDIIAVTKLSLSSFQYEGYKLDIMAANNTSQARYLVEQNPDLAVMIVDVVMETDTAGLDLIEYIRNELNNRMSRIIVSTGQPGLAPERFIIDNYDIDNYLPKTNLTSQNLYSQLRLALKGYQDLNRLETYSSGLKQVLYQIPKLYRVGRQSESKFFNSLLDQLKILCEMKSQSSILSLSLLLASINDKRAKIECAKGDFSYFQIDKDDPLNLFKAHETMRLGDQKTFESKVRRYFMPLMIEEEVVALVYIESEPSLSKNELTIMEIFLSQCASILENIRLYKQRDDDHQKAINTMADIAEFKDKDTAEHINRISYYTEIIALEMGLSKTTARAWGQASRLHDVGKMGIPDNILQKPDKLSDKEFDIMRTHTVIGASILGKISRMEVARDIALNHHEHWDGSGYPKGKLGEESPLPSRIVALADVFDALINKRCYKDPWQVEEAVEYLKLNKGKHFDPNVTDAFLRLYKRGAITQLLEGNEPY